MKWPTGGQRNQWRSGNTSMQGRPGITLSRCVGLGVLGQIPGEDETLSLYCWRSRATFFLSTQAGSLQMGLFTFSSAEATSRHPFGYPEKRNMQPELSHTQLGCSSLPVGSETTGQSTICTYQDGGMQGVSMSFLGLS